MPALIEERYYRDVNGVEHTVQTYSYTDVKGAMLHAIDMDKKGWYMDPRQKPEIHGNTFRVTWMKSKKAAEIKWRVKTAEESKLITHVQERSKVVDSWPEWKKAILGTTEKWGELG